MKKNILVLGFMVAGAGSLAAASMSSTDMGVSGSAATTVTASSDMGAVSSASVSQPQWLVNVGGLGGIRTEPTAEKGHGVLSASGGVEYIPSYFPKLGFNVDYTYVGESRTTATGRDNYIDLALNYYYYSFSTVNLWAKAGLGYNTSRNSINDHYEGFVEPGVRWNVLPYLALDGGIEYLSQTPSNAFVQSFGVNLGLSIPLDAGFSFGGSSK